MGVFMGKSIENKLEKENKLLTTAFNLFIQKGVDNTSIQDIADNAGIGKGTFYLYFKDKYEIRDKVIADYSQKLFSKALSSLEKSYINNFEDQIIFIINYILDELTKNKIVLKLVSKNLSLGLYNNTISKISNIKNDNESIYSKFVKKLNENNINLENPKVTLSTIIELVSATGFNSILYDNPLPIEEYKPYLYSIIRNILKEKLD